MLERSGVVLNPLTPPLGTPLAHRLYSLLFGQFVDYNMAIRMLPGINILCKVDIIFSLNVVLRL